MEKLYTIKETAEYLRVTPRSVERWVRAGVIGSIKVGRQRRIRESDIQNYLDANTEPMREKEEVES